jgi:hypothetical protein
VGTGFTLARSNSALIPRHDSATMDDPFGGISIRNGTLRVGLHFFANAGTWETSERTFTVRFEKGCLRLIGFAMSTAHRGSGETTDTSVNYLTRQV